MNKYVEHGIFKSMKLSIGKTGFKRKLQKIQLYMCWSELANRDKR